MARCHYTTAAVEGAVRAGALEASWRLVAVSLLKLTFAFVPNQMRTLRCTNHALNTPSTRGSRSHADLCRFCPAQIPSIPSNLTLKKLCTFFFAGFLHTAPCGVWWKCFVWSVWGPGCMHKHAQTCTKGLQSNTLCINLFGHIPYFWNMIQERTFTQLDGNWTGV